MKTLLNDLRAFAIRGNVIDMAVGIIIGIAFGKIISSLVNDVLMPPIGLLIGNMDFSYLSWTISSFGKDTVTVKYGAFINTVVDFVIIALSTFLIVKAASKLNKNDEAKTSATVQSNEEKLLAEIRDILKQGNEEKYQKYELPK